MALSTTKRGRSIRHTRHNRRKRQTIRRGGYKYRTRTYKKKRTRRRTKRATKKPKHYKSWMNKW
jgi:hypothetical protein